MLPIAQIRAWRDQAPWANDDDVEQDLIITRALFDIFRDPFLAARLAFRGGTALHRLYLAPPVRFSEDIDLVQRIPEGFGATFDRLRWFEEAVIARLRNDDGTRLFHRRPSGD